VRDIGLVLIQSGNCSQAETPFFLVWGYPFSRPLAANGPMGGWQGLGFASFLNLSGCGPCGTLFSPSTRMPAAEPPACHHARVSDSSSHSVRPPRLPPRWRAPMGLGRKTRAPPSPQEVPHGGHHQPAVLRAYDVSDGGDQVGQGDGPARGPHGPRPAPSYGRPCATVHHGRHLAVSSCGAAAPLHKPRHRGSAQGLGTGAIVWSDAPAQDSIGPGVVDIGKDRVSAVGLLEHCLNIP
jgi:hypothetical protein